jgi:hypothetical protein
MRNSNSVIAVASILLASLAPRARADEPDRITVIRTDKGFIEYVDGNGDKIAAERAYDLLGMRDAVARAERQRTVSGVVAFVVGAAVIGAGAYVMVSKKPDPYLLGFDRAGTGMAGVLLVSLGMGIPVMVLSRPLDLDLATTRRAARDYNEKHRTKVKMNVAPVVGPTGGGVSMSGQF